MYHFLENCIKIIFRYLTIVMIIFIGYIVFALTLTFQQIGYAQMDWNNDGRVDLGEIFYAMDVGQREVKQDSQQCIEYFNLKDGLPLKIDCEGK